MSPWDASAAAAMFVLFSPGYENMLWSFQLAWVMTLTFGLLHLVAADHDASRPERRDWLGLGCGLAALLSAGVAPVMVGTVGIATLLRRGWRMAAFHTVPLAVIYVTWFVTTREHQPQTKGLGIPTGAGRLAAPKLHGDLRRARRRTTAGDRARRDPGGGSR